jgi:hypothetical protein
MQRTSENSGNYCRSHGRGMLLLAAALIVGSCLPASVRAQEKGQKTFRTAAEAGDALFLALQGSEADMLAVLGQDAKQIISSGDEREDVRRRTNFLSKYLEMHRLVKEPNGTTTIYIGAENWPLPIPLAEKSGKWYFDTDAAKDEILFRRIGHNEMCAIRVSQELVIAQQEYYSEHQQQYARKIASDPGKQNGLYWEAGGDQKESPMGPLVALASVEDGPGGEKRGAEPFHGYYFRVLAAKNGEFAFQAFPAEYRNSGVMTFIVGKDGVVYEKDLGEKTAELAKSVKEYRLDAGWKKAEEEMAQSVEANKPK